MFPSSLHLVMAHARTRELRDSARAARATPVTRVIIREAASADAARLHALAELDSAQTPSGSVLVAEVDGRLRAALPLDGTPAISDPFHRGAELLELLRLRAAQLAR